MEVPSDNSANSSFDNLSSLTAGSVIVDIGTGDGRFVYQSARENPAKFYVGIDANANDLPDVIAGPPAAVVQTADVQLATRRHATDHRPEKPALRIGGRDAQRIRGALERVADALQRHADEPPGVVLAADEVPFERAELRSRTCVVREAHVSRCRESAALEGAERVDDRKGARQLEWITLSAAK